MRSNSCGTSSLVLLAPFHSDALRRYRGKPRHRLGLGLVDLDVFLHGVDEVFLQVLGRDGCLGDLAQGHDRVLVVVAVDGQRRPGRDDAGAVGGEQNELEAIFDLVDAIFDGHASHGGSFDRMWRIGGSRTLQSPGGASRTA